jgi:hypothetical protein
MEWRAADGRKVLGEERTIQLIVFKDARLFIFECDLVASEFPITFGDTKEGSFGVRVNDAIREIKGGKIENADGLVGEAKCWGKHSAWCDYSGTVSGAKVGIAIFDDPRNRYPAAWHVRAYGLMAANPFGRARSGFPATRGQTELARIPKGEHLRLRYGVFVHLGDAKEGQVSRFYEQFVRGPSPK